jgi:hypothetical protein
MSATTEPIAIPRRLCFPSHKAAAAALGISTTTLWRRLTLPKKDPRRIRQTTYGRIPVSEVERHLEAEMEATES